MRNLNPGQLKVQSQTASRWWGQTIPYLLSGNNWKQGPTGKPSVSPGVVCSPAPSKRCKNHTLRASGVLYCVCVYEFASFPALESKTGPQGSCVILLYPQSLPQCLVQSRHSDKSLLEGGREEQSSASYHLWQQIKVTAQCICKSINTW